MNHDGNQPNSGAHLEAELEARIVACVLGEASAFETAELNRLCEQQPELAIFKRRIEAVNGLVGRAVRPEQAPMRLAPERRAKILQAIGGSSVSADANRLDATGAAPNAGIILKFAEARRKRRTRWIWMSGMAASLTFVAIVTLKVGGPSLDREFAMRQENVPVNLPQSQAIELDAEGGDAIALSRFEAEKKNAITSKQRESAILAAPERVDAVGSASRQDEKRETQLGFDARNGPLQTKGLVDPITKPFAPSLAAKVGVKDFGSSINSLAYGGGRAGYVGSPAEPVVFDGYNNLYDANSVEAFSRRKLDADPSTQESLVLSPFQVEAPQARGYAATNTLAGSRIRTDLADLASPATEHKWAAGLALTTAKKSSDLPFSAAAPTDDFLNGPKQSLDSANSIMFGVGAAGAAPLARNNNLLASNERVFSADKITTAPLAESLIDSPQREISAAQEPVSTFSLHVSDVSFRLAQAALARGETPDPARIRPEEFYNAFDYGDPAPSAGDKIASRIEQSAHPFLQQRNLVRVTMKVASAGRAAGQPLRLTVLLDTSGSMEREDRIGSVRRALTVLASLLGANDRVTLIGFAREPRLLTEALPGDQAAQLADLASQTPFTGGTNLEEALKLSGELAQRHHDSTAQNRLVLITDGAANLGNADPVQLATMIENLRQQGIAFDACGVGTDGLDDAVLEALTRKGDGRYYILDDADDADAGFARQLAGAFRPAAENVKVQVRFNPARIGSYRLIGFEKHRLREEDFRNDKVDAAELAAEEAAVALYQVEVLPEGEGELGEAFVRFRDPTSGEMVERSWTMLHEPHARSFDRASPTLQLAGTAALLAEKLRGGEQADVIELEELVPVVNTVRREFAHQARVQELIAMFEQMRR